MASGELVTFVIPFEFNGINFSSANHARLVDIFLAKMLKLIIIFTKIHIDKKVGKLEIKKG